MPQPDWEELERRVARLERLMGVEDARPPVDSSPQTAGAAASEVNPGTLFPILGRALLGLAAAYLLRALTESASIPQALGVVAGVLYALFWLLWAARAPSDARIQSAVYSLTSALVLCPLLWEATLHFHAVSSGTSAGLLVVFVIMGLAVSWRRKLLPVATIVTLAGSITAAGLLIATHDLVPFAIVFLAVAAAMETLYCLDHPVSGRWIAALGADLAVWLVTWLAGREHGLPEGYAPVAYAWLLGMQVALFAIYLASTIVRTLAPDREITWSETVQCTAALAIGIGGGLRLSSSGRTVAVSALACGVVCYLMSFLLRRRRAGASRTFYTYSTLGILLVLAGGRALIGDAPAFAAWSLLAIACLWAGSSFGSMTLRIHGAIYLLLALADNGALIHASRLVLGAGNWSGGNLSKLAAALAAAGFCYLLEIRKSSANAPESTGVFRLSLAGVFVWLLAGLWAGAITNVCASVLGDSAREGYCATLRTWTLAALSLLLAWAGARWKRTELSRLVYPAMILGAYRLAMVDFNQNRKPALFLSLLAYGGALMALPRLMRSSNPSAG